MVGIVIISHSEKFAEGVVDLTRIMAKDCSIAAAGGADDGSYGTSYDKILRAVETVQDGDGVILLADMGSAAMTAEMVIENCGYNNVLLLDCPIAEAAVAASLSASLGDSLNEVKEQALSTKGTDKW